MKKRLIYIAAFALIAAACTQQEQFPQQKTGSEIRLSTRSAFTAKEKVHVWADKVSGNTHFNAWELTSDGEGNLRPTGGMQHFPDGDEALNFYAVAGNFNSGDIIAGESSFPVGGLAYRVHEDQQAGYAASDFLYAAQDSIRKQDSHISLRFYHMLSKVEVILNPGGGVTAEELKSAKVRVDVVMNGTFTPKKVTATDLASVLIRNSMVAAEEGVDPGVIRVSPKVEGDVEGDTNPGRGCAVFFPQTVKGRRFITIEIPDRPLYYYTPEELVFESGKQYTFRLTPEAFSLKVSLTVQDWTDRGSVTTPPDFMNKIKIAATTERPAGAEINEAQDVLTMSHLPAEFTLTVACDNELEFLPDATLPLTIEPLEETVWDGYNRFKITKTLIPPNFPEEKAVLRFRRKGLTEAYKEDSILLVSRSNPFVISGGITFDRLTYTCDFGKYVENELGRFDLPAGKKASLAVEADEDVWAKLVPAAENPQRMRILGGWRPNDPKADGREQSITLTFSDEDGSNPERYTLKRRNWGLPVVNIDGTWWCKYNLQGNGVDFADQIQITTDPSAGSSLYEYLKSCTDEELLKVLGHQYQGGHVQGLPLAWDATVFYYKGMATSTKDYNAVPDSLTVPPGYRLPSYADYQVFSGSHDYNLGGLGSKQFNNQASKKITVSIAMRDAQFLEQNYGPVCFYEFQVEDGADKVVLCGFGHQWNLSNGKLEPMSILFATKYQGKSWGIKSSATSGVVGDSKIQFQPQNSTKTRTLRAVKKAVEYRY